MEELTPEEKATLASQEAAHKVGSAQQAVETARQAQMELMNDTTDKRIAEAISTALRDVFGEGRNSGRFIDVSRIPLICKSIIDIHDNLEEIKQNMINQDQFWPVKTLVYGLVGIMLTGLVGAIIALVIK